jgi:allantoinase
MIIRGGSVVRGQGVEPLSIRVEGGKIVELANEISGGGAEEIDARGLHIFPGVIDAHVHFNDPGGGERDDWEGVASGSAALVAGGGTCFFDMPLNSLPPTLDAEAFDAKLAAYEGRSHADFALWGGLTPTNVDRLEELAECGVIGFKAFTANSGVPEFMSCDDLSLYRGMAKAARLNLPVAVHAENETQIAALTAAARSAGKTSVNDYLATRPITAEVEAISRAIEFAKETQCRLHVVHVSSGEGAARIRSAMADPDCRVTCETCPHYLLLCDEDMKSMGAIAKCAPPLRPATVRDELIKHVLSESIDTVGSDHSPAPARLKQSRDFFDVWGGVAGVQATLRSLLTLDIPLRVIARLTSENAARRFALDHNGGIFYGNDANLVLVDLASEDVVTREELFDRHRASPYIGRRMKGRIRRTILRGRTVFLDGRLVGTPDGCLLRPSRN